MRRRSPRPVASALDGLVGAWAPATLLADVQRVWGEVAGELVAREAQPVAERDGVVTVACASAVWAHELDLMAPGVVDRLNEVLGGPRVRALRCVATGLPRPV